MKNRQKKTPGGPDRFFLPTHEINPFMRFARRAVNLRGPEIGGNIGKRAKKSEETKRKKNEKYRFFLETPIKNRCPVGVFIGAPIIDRGPNKKRFRKE